MNTADTTPNETRPRLRCELISWAEVHRLCRRLAGLVRDSGFRPQVIVAIGRGGYIPARLLCDFLHLMGLAGVKVEHYTEGARRESHARVRYPLGIDIEGQSVLVVDDVNDSGDTFQVVIEYLQTMRPRVVRTAVMHDKTVTRFQVDYYAKRIVKWRWLIYPWALVEDITGFIHRMSPSPASRDEATQRLLHEYGIRVSEQTLADVYDFMGLAPGMAQGKTTTPEAETPR